jgi:hypothetical protein
VTIPSDAKDWTWVLQRPCGECGFDVTTHPRDEVAGEIRENALEWQSVLRGETVATRTTANKWSELEYGCHVRDVLQVFAARLHRMLSEDNPHFENWDQDETAIAGHYDQQDPTTVARELLEAADVLAARYEGVSGVQWSRPGIRSDGAHFTVESLALYGLHDPIHHLWDVTD